MMIQQVGVDVAAKRVVWIKARPDFEVLFQLLNTLLGDGQRRFWIEYPEAEKNNCDIGEGLGQEWTVVKTSTAMSHNSLKSAEELIK
jgi:hypothetical protein